MVPRADIVAVQQDIALGELVKVFESAGHSRLVVYNDTLDDPVGMVHIRDLIALHDRARAAGAATRRRAQEAAARPASISRRSTSRCRCPSTKIMREMLFVPPSMPALDLLAKMQATRIHLALVIDEYGGTDGLVSMEDIVEQIVGDIDDEHDEDDAPAVVRQPRRLVPRRRARAASRTSCAAVGAGIRRRRRGRGGRHARRLSSMTRVGRAAAARRAGARPGRLRDRGARRRSAPDQEGAHPSQQGPPIGATARPRRCARRGARRARSRSCAAARRRQQPRRRHAIASVTARAVTLDAPRRTAIVLAWGWRRALIAFAAGALSALALAPFDAWPVLFFTFPVLVWLVDGAAAGRLRRRDRARRSPAGGSASAISSPASTGSATRSWSMPRPSAGCCRSR